MAKGQTLVVIGIIIVLALFLSTQRPSVGSANKNWKEEYSKAVDLAGLDKSYFSNNNIIDINEKTQAVANQISSESINTKDAIRKTMEWVYQNIDYASQVSAQACFSESSTDAINKGLGDCVTMTKAAVSLLRAQGIAARPAGGCISSRFSCGVLFSIHPERMPRFEPVSLEDTKKRGGLHEWLEIWVPEEGWIIGEATSGQLFPKSCGSYDYHDYNTDDVGMCIISDTNYIRQCAGY
jgi:transglutaminase-like putative cysteine protease